MNQNKKTALLASLLVSVPAYANEISTLITTSQSIRDSFKYGIQAVGGAQSYASQGKIVESGTVDPGLISYAQSSAYNNALAAVQNTVYTYDPGAQEYLDQQADLAMSEVNMAVDTFVQAAQAVIEVAVVNEMAQDAQNAPDARESMALQEYIETNNVVLEDAEVDFYNDSLKGVETAAQIAGAYMAVANDAEMVATANQTAYDMKATYAEVSNSYFDSTSGQLFIDFATFGVTFALDNYFKSSIDVITQGSETEFFRTSPEGQCWFSPDPEGCLNGTTGS